MYLQSANVCWYIGYSALQCTDQLITKLTNNCRPQMSSVEFFGDIWRAATYQGNCLVCSETHIYCKYKVLRKKNQKYLYSTNVVPLLRVSNSSLFNPNFSSSPFPNGSNSFYNRVTIKTNTHIAKGKQSGKPWCFLPLWKWTNLNEKLAIDFKKDHSTFSRDVFHHTVLLQLGNIMWFTNSK